MLTQFLAFFICIAIYAGMVRYFDHRLVKQRSNRVRALDVRLNRDEHMLHSCYLKDMTTGDIASLTPGEKELIEIYLVNNNAAIKYIEFYKILRYAKEVEDRYHAHEIQLDACTGKTPGVTG